MLYDCVRVVFLMLMILMYELQDGMTPLHMAVERSSLDVAELLIRSGADVNSKDKVCSKPTSQWMVMTTTIIIIMALMSLSAAALLRILADLSFWLHDEYLYTVLSLLLVQFTILI